MIKPTACLNITPELSRTIQGCQTRNRKFEMLVELDGPDDGRVSLLPISEALDMGVGYRWAVRT